MAIRSDCAGSARNDTKTELTSTDPHRSEVNLSGSTKRSHSKRLRRRRTLQRLLFAGLAAAMFGGTTGCSVTSGVYRSVSSSDCLDDFMIGHRNRVMAAKAWYRERDCHCNKRNLDEFRAGFMQGYIDVAEGGDGCTPAVAPSEYWGWRYQNPGGQSAVNSWFAGYPLGVKAAEQDGIIHWGEIRPVGMMTPPASSPYGSQSYGTQPYGAAPVVIHDENGVPMLMQPEINSKVDDSNAPAESESDTEGDESGSPSDADPLNLRDALDIPVPDLGAPGADNEASDRMPLGPLGNVESQALDIASASDLVPRDSKTTYSLNDGDDIAVEGNNMIEEIFGAIELPGQDAAVAGTPVPVVATDAKPQQAVTVESVDESVVETASASDDLQFKFE